MINTTCWLTHDGFKVELWVGPRPEWRNGSWGGPGVCVGVVPRRMRLDVTAGNSPLECRLTDVVSEKNHKEK
jgi:hypothetical protein